MLNLVEYHTYFLNSFVYISQELKLSAKQYTYSIALDSSKHIQFGSSSHLQPQSRRYNDGVYQAKSPCAPLHLLFMAFMQPRTKGN